MTPKAKWTAAIVGLLAGNVLAMVTLATTAARGSSQVIPEYYEHATHYDEAIDRATQSRTLGWRATAAIIGPTLALELRDASGAPVEGAHVTATGYQRAHADEPFVVELAAHGGAYTGALHARTGTCDVAIVAERGAARFEQRLVLEAP